jgi:hypothetical protein
MAGGGRSGDDWYGWGNEVSVYEQGSDNNIIFIEQTWLAIHGELFFHKMYLKMVGICSWFP